MIYLILIVVFLSLLVAYTYYGQHKVKKTRDLSKMSFKESMDLTELPVVTFMVDGVKVNFLLDTGSNVSYINETLLPTLKHTPLDSVSRTVGIEGNIFDNKHCVLHLTYKEFEFKSIFAVANIDNAFNALKKENGINIHGLLGSKFFQEYNYVFDFEELIAYMK